MVVRTLSVLQHYGLIDQSELLEAEVKINCPLPNHKEKTASCHIWLDQENFYCFGCGESGTLVTLVSKIERVNTLEALRIISKIVRGSAGEGILGAQIALARPKLNPEEAIEQAKVFFFSLPKPSWEDVYHHYLLARGFDRRTLKKFDVRINSSSDYPIIIPVLEQGEFKGYMTRALDNREDKYRMSKGLQKTQILYGRVKPGSVVVVTEGILDDMKVWQNLQHLKDQPHPDISVVSTLNWSASDAQLEKLSKAGAVIAAYDNDKPGRKGYEVLKGNLKMPVVRFPLPRWIHDQAELDEYEFSTGLKLALRAI